MRWNEMVDKIWTIGTNPKLLVPDHSSWVGTRHLFQEMLIMLAQNILIYRDNNLLKVDKLRKKDNGSISCSLAIDWPIKQYLYINKIKLMNQIATIVLCRIFLNGLKICQRTYVCVHYGCFVFIIVLTECLNYIFNFNINTPVQIELLSYVTKFVSYLMPLHNVCDGEFTENVLPARFTWYQRTLININSTICSLCCWHNSSKNNHLSYILGGWIQ